MYLIPGTCYHDCPIIAISADDGPMMSPLTVRKIKFVRSAGGSVFEVPTWSQLVRQFRGEEKSFTTWC